MNRTKYAVRWTKQAKNMLAGISDRRIRQKIHARAAQLSEDPELQGKPLSGELAGYRSVRAAGQRYRIIYKVEHHRIIVLIVALGIRKEHQREDIYNLAKKLVKLRLLESSE